MLKLRLQITKEKEIRFISHLEYLRTLERSFRRARLPVAYSEGFNPHIRFSLASALGVGVVSCAEYVEVLLCGDAAETLTPLAAARQLVRGLPRGIRVLGADIVAPSEPALMSMAGGASYLITLPLAAGTETATLAAVEKFNAEDSVPFTKAAPKTKTKVRSIEVKDYIRSVKGSCEGGMMKLLFDCRITPTGSMKPMDLLRVLDVRYELKLPLTMADVTRLALYREERGRRCPMIDSKLTEAEIYGA